MPIIGPTWSLAARARRRLDRRRFPHATKQSEERWLREHVPGKSFADIGGLFEKEGEIAFLAEELGASQVTEFDVGDPSQSGFAEKHKARNSKVRVVQGDLEDPQSIAELGPHDVVWCTGVLYHTPNPFIQLTHLRMITRELLLLGTLTMPEIPGFPQACVWYPHLAAAARKPYAAGYAEKNLEGLLGIGRPIDESPMKGYANCWWGISPSALRAMLETARFEVIEERRVYRSPWVTRFICRPIEADPMMPPAGYFHDWAQGAKEGKPAPPFDDYYERSRAAGKPYGF